MATEKIRRNQFPDEVQVLSAEDLSGIESLDRRVDELMENRSEIVIHNLEYILKSRNITQAKMCADDLQGTPQTPQIAAYKKPGRDIPLRTIARIALAYGYTPEQLTGCLLDKSQLPPAAESLPRRSAAEQAKYIGSYHMAYFANDAREGSNKRSTAKALSMGLMSIFADGSAMRVLAFTKCSAGELKELSDAVNARGADIRSEYRKIVNRGDSPRAKYYYEGELSLTEHMADISLRQISGSDVVHIRLHNRAAVSSEGSLYKGGPATMLSTSRGEEHMPCVQALILSRKGFGGIAREALAEQLYMEPPEINLKEETRSIIAYAKALLTDDGFSPLPQLAEEDKVFMLESFVEKKLSEVLKRNVLQFYKISTRKDADIYKNICR